MLTNRIPSFDFVRGVAITMVFFAHAIHFYPTEFKPLDAFIGLGRFGVQLFFILSGASVCLMWDARSTETARTLKFLTRRIFRIAPLYWAFIPLSLLFSTDLSNHWSPNGVSTLDITLNVLLVHALYPTSINSVVPGGWSISVEFFLYLFFPFIALKFGQRASLYIALAALIWAGNIFISGLINARVAESICNTCPQYLIRDFLFLSPLNQLPAFLLGCSIFHLYKSKGSLSAYILLSVWALSASLWGLLSNADRAPFGAILLALGFFTLYCFKNSIRNEFLQLIGRNSYALYLCHFILLETISDYIKIHPGPLNFLVGGIATFAAALALATLIHRLIDPAVHTLQSKLLTKLDIYR